MINENLEEEIFLNCPYCIEINTIMVDMTAGHNQEFVYDCSVCCHPIVIKVKIDSAGTLTFSAEKES